jgi:hypothetical protein
VGSIQSAVPAIVTKYTISSANDVPERDPKNWNLQGSNNGTSWVNIDTRTGETFASRRLTKTYEIANNTTPYLYYRLNITANNGHTATQFSEWELIQRKTQTIAFSETPDKTYGDAPFILSATATSNLPVTLEILSGPGSLSQDSLITITGAGTILLRATQAGNDQYFPVSAEYTVEVQKADQTITFSALPPVDKTSAVVLGATSTSGLPVSYEVLYGPGVVTDSVLTFRGEGEVTLQASQLGNENYNPATEINQTVLVYGEDVKKDGIRLMVYPNPTAGLLKVKLENKKDKDYTFTVYDRYGNVVQSSVLARSHKMFDIDFNLQNAASGTYYLHVSDGTEKIVRMIIKE